METQSERATPSIEIRVENLYKLFGERIALDGINLEVSRGEMVAIVGGSGSGKTTLLRHVIGLDQPDRGRVLIADHESPGTPLLDLSALSAAGMEKLQRHWGVVFQSNALMLGQTVAYNIALPLREVQHLDESTIREKTEFVLHAVALDPSRDLDLRIDQLSGGMAKRVAIARAWGVDPALLLYDEPTTGLDPRVAEQIQSLICLVEQRKTSSGQLRTSLLITHDKDMLYRLRPRVIMLDAGRIIFDGTYEAFRQSDSPAIKPYFELMPALQSAKRAA